MACDMPEPCKFQSFDSCQKRFLWTQKEVDLAPHPVVGLVLQGGDAAKFPQALGFESLDPFFPESASRVLPQACRSDSVTRLLDVYEVVEQIMLAL